MRLVALVLLVVLATMISAMALSAQTYDTANTSNLALRSKYGEMYLYVASVGVPVALTIDENEQYHGMGLTASGTSLNGWTYKDGTVGDILSVADAGGGVLLITASAAHNLTVGDYVVHTGFTVRTSYQGKYEVLSTPAANTYTVTGAFDTSSDTGHFQRSWSLRANPGSAGIYLVSFSISAQAVNATTDFRWELNQNTTELDNISAQYLFSNAGRPASVSSSGIVTVNDGDVIYPTMKNVTDATNLSVWIADLVITRL